jgi:hypothetical protein
LYYLQPGQACAISMICAAKMETSQIMAKVWYHCNKWNNGWATLNHGMNL